MHKEILKELLNKHHHKSATPEEEILLQAWTEEVDRRSQDQEIFHNKEEENKLGEKMWDQINPLVPVKLKMHTLKRMLRYAAIFTGFLLASWLLFDYNKKTNLSDYSRNAVLWDTVSAAPQTIKQLILKDGSEVYLNAGTRIRYHKNADVNKREIELLYGEARFDVTHDIHRPFIVYSRGIKTRVLGTQFTISAYADLPDIKVNVYRGKVAVSAGIKLLSQLVKGEGLVYNVREKTANKSTATEGTFDPEKQTYYLKGASFQELALRIRNTYGYELKASKKRIKESHFTGELNLKEPINVTMNNFSKIYGGTFTIKGKEVLMY